MGDLCVGMYRLVGWKDGASDSSFEQNTNDTQVFIDSLVACESYTIQIIAETKKALDGKQQVVIALL